MPPSNPLAEQAVRRTATVVVAGFGITVVAVIAAFEGWIWAVAAWLGSSSLAFAVTTALANRRALTTEQDERQLLQPQAPDQET
jgi:hypothetical protein